MSGRPGAGTPGAGTPGADELYFLPLGGTGEIGMNLNLYGHAGRWLMVDLGVTFSDGGTSMISTASARPASTSFGVTIWAVKAVA